MGAADVVVLGAGGLLGRTLVRFLGDRARGFSHAELDITDENAVGEAISSVRPALVVNCAAMTNVDACESEPEQAWAVNARGPGHIARAAADVGAGVVHVSTDYVFDGARGAYTEADETNPIQVYGRAKLAGEDLVRNGNQRHYVVRSAWIYGAGGHNFVSRIPGLVAQGGVVRVVGDQRSSPTFAPDLAAAVSSLAESGSYGTYHVVNEGSCSYAEFAQHIAELDDGPAEVVAIASSEVPRPAPRPRDSSLVGAAWSERGFAPLRVWREAAAEYRNDVHRARTP